MAEEVVGGTSAGPDALDGMEIDWDVLLDGSSSAASSSPISASRQGSERSITASRHGSERSISASRQGSDRLIDVSRTGSDTIFQLNVAAVAAATAADHAGARRKRNSSVDGSEEGGDVDNIKLARTGSLTRILVSSSSTSYSTSSSSSSSSSSSQSAQGGRHGKELSVGNLVIIGSKGPRIERSEVWGGGGGGGASAAAQTNDIDSVFGDREEEVAMMLSPVESERFRLKPAEVVVSLFKAFNAGDLDAMSSLIRLRFREDCIIRTPALREAITGKQDMIRYCGLLMEIYPDGMWVAMRSKNKTTHVAGTPVVQDFVFTGTRVFSQSTAQLFEFVKQQGDLLEQAQADFSGGGRGGGGGGSEFHIDQYALHEALQKYWQHPVDSGSLSQRNQVALALTQGLTPQVGTRRVTVTFDRNGLVAVFETEDIDYEEAV